MDYSFDDDEQAFGEEVDEFLAGWGLEQFQYFSGRGGVNRRLYAELGQRGWLSQSWPASSGGAGRSITFEYILWNRLAYHRAARPDIGPGIVAHAIAANGSREQVAHWIPLLASGQICFALGYSEPGAGSDLSAVRTRATHHGSVYRVSGAKCWTSDAEHADYLWLLCRTDPNSVGSRGLSLLIVPMRQPGIEVTPIPTIDGHRLSSVFLDEVSVPESHRIGAENEAWRIIREALAVERHIQVLPGRLRRDFEDVIELIGEHPDARRTLVELEARVEQVEASSLATVAALVSGMSGVEEAARTKYLGSRLAQEIPRAGVEFGGVAALDASSPAGFLWRQSIMETIAGGSIEMMLGMLARSRLHLRGAR